MLTVTAVLLTGLMGLLLHLHSRGGGLLFIDWWVYSLASQRLLAAQSLYLDMQVAGPYSLLDVTPHGYIYPPPSAVLFLPFAAWPLGLAAWLTASVTLFISGLAAVIHRELGRVGPTAMGLVLLPLMLFVPLAPAEALAPFFDGIGTANINVALAGLLAWTWGAGGRLRWLPWVAGIAAVMKVFPGALALWAARRAGWRPIMIALGTFIVVGVATLPLVGVEEWRRFFLAFLNAETTCVGSRLSIACLTEPLLGPSAARFAAMASSALLLVLAVVVRGDFRAFVLLTLGMLASIHSLSQHYYLFLYVLVVIAAARLVARRREGVAGRPLERATPEGSTT